LLGGWGRVGVFGWRENVGHGLECPCLKNLNFEANSESFHSDLYLLNSPRSNSHRSNLNRWNTLRFLSKKWFDQGLSVVVEFYACLIFEKMSQLQFCVAH